MTKKMGEFEERPVVKEAVPVPLERRKPTGWIAATVIFALVAIGALSFVVIDKELAKKPDSSLKCNESKIDDGKNNNVSDSDMKGFAIRDYFGVLYVTKKGEVYLSPTTETEKDNDWPFLMRVSDYDQNKLPGVRGKYTITEDDIEGFSAGPTDMVQEDYKVTFDGYKIDIDGVVAMYGVSFGHAFNGYNFALVKSDGTMGWLILTPGDSNMKASALLTKNVEGYENVAGVMSTSPAGGTRRVLVIKKDGGQEWMDYELLTKLEGLDSAEE